MKAKTVIVGGGVMGVAIAWQAARRRDPLREPIVLLEKRALAAGSSGRSGAILRQFYSDRVVAAMARDSLRVYANLERDTGRDIGFERTGVVTIVDAANAADVERLERNVATMREIGIEVEIVRAPRLRALVPGIEVGDRSLGAFEPAGGAVDPVRTVEALAALAREQGAVTRVGVRAVGLLVENGRVSGVETDEGRIEAEQVVVAAGPWTRALLATAGIDVPLRVVRPEQHFVAMPDAGAWSRPDAKGAPLGQELAQPPIAKRAVERSPHPVLLDLEHGFYTRCEPSRSRTRVGRADYTHDLEVADPDQLDEEVGEPFRVWARERLERRLPIYAGREDRPSEVGLYTLSPDAQALIGPLPGIEGLFIVSGFSGHGFKLAPSVGEGVAQRLAGQPVSAFDPQFFDPRRFEHGSKAQGGAFGF